MDWWDCSCCWDTIRPKRIHLSYKLMDRGECVPSEGIYPTAFGSSARSGWQPVVQPPDCQVRFTSEEELARSGAMSLA